MDLIWHWNSLLLVSPCFAWPRRYTARKKASLSTPYGLSRLEPDALTSFFTGPLTVIGAS